MARTGAQKFAVFLCKFSDTSTAEPHPADFYRQLVAERGTNGLNDYWIAASQGAINLDGSEIFDWRTLPQTKADFLAANPRRGDKINGGAAAFPEIVPSNYAGIITVFNVDVGDGGNSGGGVLASPTGESVTFLAHETGHVFGLQHSFDQSDRKDVSWSAPGEYFDKYDIMSAMNVFAVSDPTFELRGPLLCAPNLDRMGWLPPSRVWSSPDASSSSDQFDLVSMSHPEIPGYMAAHLGSNLYVEFRTVELWDAAILYPGVLLHVLSGPNAIILASDKTNFINYWQPGQVYGPSDLTMAINGGTQIRIESFDLQAKKARIDVRFAAHRPFVGPGQIFGGAAGDGGGWLILNGKFIPIQPGGPSMAIAEALSALATAEANLGAIASGLGLNRLNNQGG